MAALVRAPRGPGARKIAEAFLLLRGKVGTEGTGTPRLQRPLAWPEFHRSCLFCGRSSCATGRDLGDDALLTQEGFVEVVTSSSAWKRQMLWFTECLLSLGTFGAWQPKAVEFGQSFRRASKESAC